MLVFFFVKKRTITYEGKRLCSIVFSTKKELLSTNQSAVREAPTVLSKLPSLMAADKPCLLLQPSLHGFDFYDIKKILERHGMHTCLLLLIIINIQKYHFL